MNEESIPVTFNDETIEVLIKEKKRSELVSVQISVKHKGKNYQWPLELHQFEWRRDKLSIIQKFSTDIISGLAQPT